MVRGGEGIAEVGGEDPEEGCLGEGGDGDIALEGGAGGSDEGI